ncbi:rhodanese-like domain-containing protein [Pelagibacteraceae bacterium]|nr:rhodanese-like domain-containing protein [Pelagibacteraceae bacterium]
MLIRFCIKIIVCLLTVKFVFADIVDVNNEQIKELSKNNIPIVDVRRSSEWEQTGVVPKSILLTFFDKEGNYNFDEWYEKLRLEIDEGKPIILICRTGRRTNIIAKMMEIKKFDNVIYNAKNGITSWIDEKLIIVKPRY